MLCSYWRYGRWAEICAVLLNVSCWNFWRFWVTVSKTGQSRRDRIVLVFVVITGRETRGDFVEERERLWVSLYGGVASLSSDTALVANITGHPDISLLSPCPAPAVLNNPVVLIATASVSYSENSVIELPWGASPLVIYSRSVQL